ncbi:helix-turn-helix transcriptional regulator [Actinomadura opuntiae]|uniref:helix-turn-helix transcriptional regulator n=1 Tax=Actinomadura sp. OS1-43 TaxID=604315 RepID=UPI00333F30D3
MPPPHPPTTPHSEFCDTHLMETPTSTPTYGNPPRGNTGPVSEPRGIHVMEAVEIRPGHGNPRYPRRVRRVVSAELAASLRIWRRRAGLSQRRLAAAVGSGRPHLANLEAGRRAPSHALADALAYALELTQDERERLLAEAVPDAGWSSPRWTRLRPTSKE